jgi:hypothetical protein
MGNVKDLTRLDNVVFAQLEVWVGINEFVPALAVACYVLGDVPEAITLLDSDGHALVIVGLNPAEPVEEVLDERH